MALILERVETHAHIMPREIYGMGGAYGPEIIRSPTGGRMYRAGNWQSAAGAFEGEQSPGLYDPQARLAELDKQDIDVMGISITPMFYLYGAPAADGTNYARRYNDLLAQYCSFAPTRFFFMPTLPLQDINASLKELDRTTRELGGRAVNMGTDNIAGRNLDDEALFPIYEMAQERDLPLFLHPAPVGTDDPDFKPSANVKDKYSFSFLLGYNYREMVAFATLVLSGVLDRYPRLKVCIPHGGGFVPYQIGRIAWAAASSRMKIAKCQKPVADYLPNFFFDTVVHEPEARRFMRKICSADNILVGSNFGGWDWVDGFEFARTMVDDEPDLKKIWAGNATRLFKLDGMGRNAA
jgi:aminocarboxymuconate-semialdehyde decarboxylase